MLSKYDDAFAEMYCDIMKVNYNDRRSSWFYGFPIDLMKDHAENFAHEFYTETIEIMVPHKDIISYFITNDLPLDELYNSASKCFSLSTGELEKMLNLFSYYKKDLTQDDITMIRLSI